MLLMVRAVFHATLPALSLICSAVRLPMPSRV
jgi:hypothetical protein